MKKAAIILLGGLVFIALAGTAIAETVAPQVPVSVPDAQNQDFYKQMYEYCHGPNGMMNRCFGGNYGTAPQGFGPMMGGMMGW
ncbi:MAG: hypothetical protein GXW85_06155 [Clostridia bacterium]|nr:hypothetical protein [Clostridia bacterium]